MTMRSRALLALAIFSCFILLLLLQNNITQKQRQATFTIYSQAVNGTSIFFELAKRLGSNSLVVKKKAILNDSYLSGVDALLLFDPQRSPTAKESALIDRYVRQGGWLIVSFLGEQSFEKLKPLLKALKITAAIKRRPEFKNGSAEIHMSPHNSSLFSQNESYAFYSDVGFDTKNCREHDFACFVRSIKIGSGHVVLLAGFPPVSNGLIGKADNYFLAQRMLDRFPRIMVDEYGHFFSHKTLGDLLSKPNFILPMLGMIALAVAFFFFGYIEEYLPAAATRPGPRRRYHELNQAILAGLIERSGSLSNVGERQALFLRHLYPDRITAIDEALFRQKAKPTTNKLSEPLQLSYALIKLHQQFLEERGVARK